MEWRRNRFTYLTDNWQLNQALNTLDAELSDFEAKVEESATWDELEDLRRAVDQLSQRVQKIEKFLQAKFQEAWDSFEG